VLRQAEAAGVRPATAILLSRWPAVGEEEAIRFLKGVQQRHPTDFWVNWFLGSLLRPKQPVEAAGYLRAALAVRPDRSALHSDLGLILDQLGDREGAVRSLEQAIRLSPRHAMAHTNLGLLLRRKGDLEGALKAHREAVRLAAGSALAHSNLGVALEAKGDWQGALRAFREASRLDPREARYHSQIGALLLDRRDLEGAVRDLQRAVQLDPRSAGDHCNLAAAWSARGDRDEALRSARRAVQAGPRFPLAHYTLGMARWEKQDHEGAVRAFREAIRLQPGYVKAYCNLGTVLREMDDPEEALRYLREAVRLAPKFAEARAGLAIALFYHGQFGASKDAGQQALAVLPAGHPLRKEVTTLLAQLPFWLKLEARLREVLAGQATPRDARDLMSLAHLAGLRAQQRYATAVRFYTEAIAHGAQARGGLRIRAAFCAVRAGLGQGKDSAGLDGTDRAQLRYAALCWLQSDLAEQATAIREGSPEAARRARAWLAGWSRHNELAGMRAEVLTGLPEAERTAWEGLWAQVDVLLEPGR
jgi:tetratricopeptide (TPR) repeat protein